MRTYIKVGNETFSVGDVFIAKALAEKQNICAKGFSVTLRAIKDDDIIGITSDIDFDDWGNLDGIVQEGRGLWLSLGSFMDCFARVLAREVIVSCDVEYKKQNLKGMRGRLLKTVGESGREHCFVEMEKNIGAGSADGLGKSGHCVLLSTSLLKIRK